MSLGTGVYGTNASDAVSYSIAGVSSGNSVTSAKFNELIYYINAERVRRGNSGFSLTLTNPIQSGDYNSMVNAMNVYGPADTQAYMGYGANTSGSPNSIPVSSSIVTYPQVGPPSLPGTVSPSVTIVASHINDLISSIYNAGIQCTCNCNYCTCNCNYCTCNCNYSCTCNCNYSDERLKTNIELIGQEQGINVYTWSYIWDCATTYVGVLAQELIGTKYQDALSQDSNGYYMVDYSQLPVKMIEA